MPACFLSQPYAMSMLTVLIEPYLLSSEMAYWGGEMGQSGAGVGDQIRLGKGLASPCLEGLWKAWLEDA